MAIRENPYPETLFSLLCATDTGYMPSRRWAEKREKWKLQRAYHRLASHERIISALERVKTEKRSTMEKEK
ncbi:hypothetical protein TNCV_4441411 [Trichonephila clavipes]|nr:hypothetical protein TNCV_4441411 [Trichonephila clavipes]